MPERRASALPSPQARALAFVAIIVAGAAGAFIGYGFVAIQCDGDCATPNGIGALLGGLFFAGGVAIVSVVTMRAMGEWRRIQAEKQPNGNGSGPSPG
ncbi:MAG TPA: hypothetical protein VGO92_05580 [Acidimicrobiales bacterium]|nr:hypothetical protein [Acidimicrobiales bacterium]